MVAFMKMCIFSFNLYLTNKWLICHCKTGGVCVLGGGGVGG